MLSNVTFQKLAQWTNGKATHLGSGDLSVTTISTDTRSLKPGDIYLALRGDNFDGNQFLKEAVSAGASGLICEIETQLPVPTLRVPDSLKALVAIAEKLRENFRGNVFAITGSAGKSSTKDMVATLLGSRTVRSPASFNNLLGVSRTLCLVEDFTENLVLEMGMNNFHEIAELCQHFKPQFGLITNIGDAHIGKLGGQEGIFHAKKELFDFLGTSMATRGIALNLDDALVVSALEKAISESRRKEIPLCTYSTKNSSADVYLSEQIIDPNSAFLQVTLELGKERIQTELPIYGEHQAQNIAAAVALVRLAGVAVADIAKRLKEVRPSSHRGEILRLSEGKILIDESYNSNPTALLSSLESLTKLNPKLRRVLVIGEMRELGQFSEDLHTTVGEYLVEWYGATKAPFILMGVRGHTTKILEVIKTKLPQIPVYQVKDVEEASKLLPGLLKPSDIILIKGSRGVVLDKLIARLMAKLGP